jgi:hypothetical protein
MKLDPEALCTTTDFRVFIDGVDVTQWIEGQVVWVIQHTEQQ